MSSRRTIIRRCGAAAVVALLLLAAALPAPADLAASRAASAVPAAEPDDFLDQAVALIERSEGRRSRAYRDSRGRLTVGVGFNLDRPGARLQFEAAVPGLYREVRAGRRLTNAQIDALLRADAATALATARRQVPGFDQLPRDARLVLTDMAYNLGGFSKWTGLKAALAKRDFPAAAAAMRDSRWSRQVGRRADRLIAMMARAR